MLQNGKLNDPNELTETVDTQTLSPYNMRKINMEMSKMKFNITDLNPTSIFVISVVPGILTILVHIVFAVAVYQDAKRLQTLTFLGPVLWCVVTLVGGVITAGIYWVMHHSLLNPAIVADSTDSNE